MYIHTYKYTLYSKAFHFFCDTLFGTTNGIPPMTAFCFAGKAIEAGLDVVRLSAGFNQK